jgi:hypothetical protein
MCEECEELVKAIDAYITKADDNLDDTLDNEGYAASKKTVKATKQIEQEVADILENETELFLQRINESVDLKTFAEKVWPSVVLEDTTAAKLTEMFKEQLNEFMPPLIEAYIQRTDKSLKLDRVSSRTLSWIDEWSGQLGNIMQLNSHAEIEDILKRGLKNGDSIAKFTEAIMDSGIRDEYYRARSTAITEVLRAHSVSQQEAYMQSPVVTKKKWRHTGEYKNQPRENHVEMDGQTVDKGERYTLVGADGVTYYPMYPRDIILPAGEQALVEMDEAWEDELDTMYRNLQAPED